MITWFLKSFLFYLVILVGSVMFPPILSGVEEDEPEKKRRKPIPLATWYNRLHAIVREKSRVKPNNDVEKKQFRDALLAEISKQLDGTSFYFKTKVKNVRWKDGIAFISTEDELKTIRVRPQPTTLSAKRSQLFEVIATAEEVASIQPGAVLRFEATVKFHPGRILQSNATFKAQVLYDLTYIRLGPGALGVFTTNASKISVNKSDLQPRWNEDPKKK